MALTIPRYSVALARPDVGITEAAELGEGEGYDVHTVAVLHADQLMAEQAGPRYGLGTDLRAQPMAYTTLWAWAALHRSGVEVPEFPLFKSRVLVLTEVKDSAAANADPDPAAADPTVPSPGTG